MLQSSSLLNEKGEDTTFLSIIHTRSASERKRMKLFHAWLIREGGIILLRYLQQHWLYSLDLRFGYHDGEVEVLT